VLLFIALWLIPTEFASIGFLVRCDGSLTPNDRKGRVCSSAPRCWNSSKIAWGWIIDIRKGKYQQQIGMFHDSLAPDVGFCRLCRSLLLRRYICLFGGFSSNLLPILCSALRFIARNLKTYLVSVKVYSSRIGYRSIPPCCINLRCARQWKKMMVDHLNTRNIFKTKERHKKAC